MKVKKEFIYKPKGNYNPEVIIPTPIIPIHKPKGNYNKDLGLLCIDFYIKTEK